MGPDSLDRHQLAGFDDRERGFSRLVEFERGADGVRAILRYEQLRVATAEQPSQDDALQLLIRTLQAQGYRQLRTQLNARAGAYLGSQEPWVEYPDEDRTGRPARGVLATLRKWFHPRLMP
jgi:hypothetical protein